MAIRGAVVVTGAGSGLGYAVTARLTASDVEVVGIDIDDEGLRRAVAEFGDRFQSALCDVRDPVAVQAVFDGLAAARKSLGGLVNAAGIGGEPGDVTRTSIDAWQTTLDVNLTGAFIVSRAAIPLLREAGGGSIVHIASQLGLVGTTGAPAYGASKAGMVGLARSMALDHAREGIRVNAVCPGPVDTPMFRASSGPANLERLTTEKIPWGRIGEPSEIAALVVFLLGDEAAYLTGAAIPIDGGWTAS